MTETAIQTQTRSFTRLAEIALIGIALAASVACGGSGGGGSDTAPSPTGLSNVTGTVTTQWGDIQVTSEVGPPNWSKLEASADAAISRIASQHKYASFQGVRVVVANECSGGGQQCYGRYYPGEKVIVALQGYENVLEHELQHHACHDLGLGNVRGGECCRLQDHPGGYDLSCNPV